MFQVFKHISDINISAFKHLYREQLLKMQRCSYPNLDDIEGALSAEQDFYYDLNSFFRMNGSFIAVWQENKRYVSALKIEKFKDGFLISGFETDPDFRNTGFGSSLLKSVLMYISDSNDLRIYSHIKKNNVASLCVHQKCGFQIHCDYAEFLDGTVSNDSYTMIYNKQK